MKNWASSGHSNGIDWDLKIDSMMGSMGFNESIGQSMKQSYVNVVPMGCFAMK